MSENLTLHIDVDAPPETVFAAALDWERQHEWILATRVRVVSGDGRSVGSEVTATTGIGPLGITDTMRLTVWAPPRRCEVVHTGRVVRGTAAFAVQPRGRGSSRFVWSEQLDLPLGAVGRLGFRVLRPVFAWGLARSLSSFADFAGSYPR